uniref:Uncharacterized protein n=1 Tax=Noctiluca scintillans TaxID=2966 RepID=A0A7S1F2G5_NOCSC|mmetsp:Transcript_26783/g.70370  ORF Transcript_26783/g.70370 Transcript_26783/m.70370 type:complete len:472 (+) Transcript_26783:224-1639(+)
MPRFAWAPCDLAEGVGDLDSSPSCASGVRLPLCKSPGRSMNRAPTHGRLSTGSAMGSKSRRSPRSPVHVQTIQHGSPPSTPLVSTRQSPRLLSRASPQDLCKAMALQPAASECLASTLGFASELQSQSKGTLMELQQRDDEIRRLRQALSALARESGSLKPSVRRLLSSRDGPVDADEPKDVQFIRVRGCSPDGGKTPSRSECDDSRTPESPEIHQFRNELAAVRSELADALERERTLKSLLAKARGREERLASEVESLQVRALQEQAGRKAAELDAERARMCAEDCWRLSTHSGGPQTDHRSESARRSARKNVLGIPTNRSPRSASRGRRYGRTSPTPSRAPQPDALSLAENLVTEMFSREPSVAALPVSSQLEETQSLSTEPEAAWRAEVCSTNVPRLSTRQRPGSDHSQRRAVCTPPQTTQSETPVLLALNGRMPRFPSADFDLHRTAERRRSCPSLGPKHSNTVPQL